MNRNKPIDPDKHQSFKNLCDQNLNKLLHLDLEEQRKEVLNIFLDSFGKIANPKDLSVGKSFIETIFDIKKAFHTDQQALVSLYQKEIDFIEDKIIGNKNLSTFFKCGVVKNLEENLVGLNLFGNSANLVTDNDLKKNLQIKLEILLDKLVAQMYEENDKPLKDSKVTLGVLEHIISSTFYNPYYKYLVLQLANDKDKQSLKHLFKSIPKIDSSVSIKSLLLHAYILSFRYLGIDKKLLESREPKSVSLPHTNDEVFDLLEYMFNEKKEKIRSSLRTILDSNNQNKP
jgi:hypothetical protein